jgi:hypothetical protein
MTKQKKLPLKVTRTQNRRESESCRRKILSSRERTEAAAETDNSHIRADKMEENRIALTWNQRGSWRPEGVDSLNSGAAVLRRGEGVLQITVLNEATGRKSTAAVTRQKVEREGKKKTLS